MKIIYKLLSKLALFIVHIGVKLYAFSEKKQNHYFRLRWFAKPIMSAENAVAILVGIAFLIYGIILYAPQNIQNMYPPDYRKHEQKEPEKPTIHDEYKIINAHFPWLTYTVYKIIIAEAEQNKLDPLYVMSVIQYESGNACGNNLDLMRVAVSRSGARGIMQIMPFHAPNPYDLYKIDYNVMKGCWYLGLCVEHAGGDLYVAARMYNQGIHGNPARYRNWVYVNRINALHKKVLTENVMMAKI